MLYYKVLIIFSVFFSGKFIAQDLHPFISDSLWGYQNEKRETIISPQYQYAKKFVNDFAVVYKNDSAGLINKKNEIIFPFKFNRLTQITPQIFIYGLQSKYYGEFYNGIINIKGEKLTSALYYDIQYKQDRFFVNQKKEKKKKHFKKPQSGAINSMG